MTVVPLRQRSGVAAALDRAIQIQAVAMGIDALLEAAAHGPHADDIFAARQLTLLIEGKAKEITELL